MASEKGRQHDVLVGDDDGDAADEHGGKAHEAAEAIRIPPEQPAHGGFGNAVMNGAPSYKSAPSRRPAISQPLLPPPPSHRPHSSVPCFLRRRMPGAGEEDKKPADGGVHIRLRVVGSEDGNMLFRIKRSTQLRKVMNAYCDRRSVDTRAIVFLFKGRWFSGNQTPDELGIEDGDEIDAMRNQGWEPPGNDDKDKNKDKDDDKDKNKYKDDGGEAREQEMVHVCCVCMLGHKGAAFIPCGHTFCRPCSRELWASRGKCPLCNGVIKDVLDIY